MKAKAAKSRPADPHPPAPRSPSSLRQRLGVVLLLFLLAGALAGGWYFFQQRESSAIARVRTLVEAGRLKEAIEAVDAAPRLFISNPEAAILAAALYRRAGKEELFQGSLETAARLGIAPQEVELQKYLIRIQMGEDVPVEAHLKKLGGGITKEQQEEAFDAMTRGTLRNHRLQAVRDLTQRWLALQPNSLAARLHAARAWQLEENMERATASLEEVVKLAPGHPEATSELALLLLIQNQLERAQKLLVDLLSRRPNDARANLLLADCERRSGHADEARKRIEKLLTGKLERSDLAIASKTLGQLQFDGEDFASAAATLQKAAKLAPRDPEVRQALAAALAATGDAEAATEQRSEAQRLQAIRDELLQAMAKARKHPDHLPTRLGLADALYNSGSEDAALATWQAILSVDPKNDVAKARLEAALAERRGPAADGFQPQE